jgi:hypothetical protein
MFSTVRLIGDLFFLVSFRSVSFRLSAFAWLLERIEPDWRYPHFCSFDGKNSLGVDA